MLAEKSILAPQLRLEVDGIFTAEKSEAAGFVGLESGGLDQAVLDGVRGVAQNEKALVGEGIGGLSQLLGRGDAVERSKECKHKDNSDHQRVYLSTVHVRADYVAYYESCRDHNTGNKLSDKALLVNALQRLRVLRLSDPENLLVRINSSLQQFIVFHKNPPLSCRVIR